MPLHFPIEPMKAAIGALPPASNDHEWAYEIKWDGYRTLAFVSDGRVRLQSSSGLDVTATYPELAGLPDAVNASSAIIDGELVVLDEAGRPNFVMLQRHETQVAFYAFDVLQIDGTDCISLPYEQRRALLGALLEPGSHWMVPSHQVGDGAALLEATAAQGLEGVMAKRLGSPYVPGKRSPNWRKVKNRLRLEVVVGGFDVGTGSRATTFGSLLVGLPADDGSLRFCGAVGTGFTQARLEELTAALRALTQRDCPFATLPPRSYLKDKVTWVRPELRAVLEIAEITNDGFIRHPSFITLV